MPLQAVLALVMVWWGFLVLHVPTNSLVGVFKERRQEMSRRKEEQELCIAPLAMAQNRLYHYHFLKSFVLTMLYMVNELEAQFGLLTNPFFGVFKERKERSRRREEQERPNSLFGVFKERRQEKCRREEEQELGTLAPSAMVQDRLYLYHLLNPFVLTMLYMVTKLVAQLGVLTNFFFGVFEERKERSRKKEEQKLGMLGRLNLYHLLYPFVPMMLYKVTELEAQIGVLTNSCFRVFKER